MIQNKKELMQKIIVIILGSILSAFGIMTAIGAGFGGATLAVLWQGVSKATGLTIGQSSFLVAVIMILVSFFLDRKQIQIGTILYQIVYSSFVDVFAKVHLVTSLMAVNFVIMLIGIFLFAVGTALYASADLGRGSYEALTFSIVTRSGKQVTTIRMILDAAVVILGVLMGGKFGLCTICTILLSGPLIQKTLQVIHSLQK